MNLKEIEFVFQTFLKPEFDLIDLSDPIISTINIAKSLKKFYNISNIYMLRNFVSNFKKIIESSPELNPDDPYLNLIMKSLIVEILYGKQQEIKGSLKSIMSAVSEKQENIKKKVSESNFLKHFFFFVVLPNLFSIF